MEIFTVKPARGASKRTKERIKQHGPRFICHQTNTPSCFNGLICFLLESLTTDWSGWIPIREIEWDETMAKT